MGHEIKRRLQRKGNKNLRLPPIEHSFRHVEKEKARKNRIFARSGGIRIEKVPQQKQRKKEKGKTFSIVSHRESNTVGGKYR